MDYTYQATVVHVVDGDTIDLNVDLGFRCYVQVRFRLHNMDAPERFTDEGKVAKAFLEEMLPISTTISIQTYKNETDKYGRWIAEIFKDGVSVNQTMIDKGYAVAKDYD